MIDVTVPTDDLITLFSPFNDQETAPSSKHKSSLFIYQRVIEPGKHRVLLNMKLASFVTIIYLFGWKCGDSMAAVGGFAMKNFVLFYGVTNVTKEEMTTLVNLAASTAIANITQDPYLAMFDSKTVILNYSIVNIVQPENFTNIPLKKNHTIDYFKNLLQQYNNTNKDKKLSLKKLQKALQMCAPFSGVSVVTNLEPDDSDLLPDILQLIKNRSLEVVISPFNSSTIKSMYIGYRYYHPNDEVSVEYRQINKIKYDLDHKSYLNRILNEFVYFNAKTGPFDTSIVMIFDWICLIQLSINSNLQEALKLFLDELHDNKQMFSYQGHSARIKKFSIVSSNMEHDELPVIEIDLMKKYNFEYFDEIVANLGNTNDTSRFSMKSLVKGLDISLPNGLIYLYTATQPQDTELLSSVFTLMEDKKVTVQIAYMRDRKYQKPDIEYQRINEASFKNRLIPT